jgi:hypothetical protein
MKVPEPGLIVSAAELEGSYVLLDVDPHKHVAVLLSRDGKRTIIRGVSVNNIRVMADQLIDCNSRMRALPAHSKQIG